MTRDYSGKHFSRKMNKGLLITNLILLVCALGLMIANIHYDEVTVAIGMGLVVLVSAINSTLAILRLKGKKI